MALSRNEGYVATNRLTGGYLAHHEDKRYLINWVKAKARHGTWVDISFVARGGGESKVAGFMVDRPVKATKTSTPKSDTTSLVNQLRNFV